MRKPEDLLARHPLYIVFQIGLKIEHLNRKLEQRTGISLTQWALLKQLVEAPTISALALAETVGVQPCTMTQGLKRLEKKGLLHVGKDPRDSRRKTVTISRSGKQALDAADQKVREWVNALGADGDEARRFWEQLLRLV